jgi:hypothetical protein
MPLTFSAQFRHVDGRLLGYIDRPLVAVAKSARLRPNCNPADCTATSAIVCRLDLLAPRSGQRSPSIGSGRLGRDVPWRDTTKIG